MRVAFSECVPEYDSHLAPYQVLGFIENDETPATAFELGMLPSNRELTRFYLARSVRVTLDRYVESKRERYLRKRCARFRSTLLARGEFRATDDWVELCLGYMNEGSAWDSRRRAPFTAEEVLRRLDKPVATHVLAMTDSLDDGAPAALALLYIEDSIAYYAMAFYDLRHRPLGIGSFLMSSMVATARDIGLTRLYLGTCYSPGALYKTRFTGLEFFDGITWSADRDRLRAMLDHQDELRGTHLLNHPGFLSTAGEPQAGDAIIRLSAAASHWSDHDTHRPRDHRRGDRRPPAQCER